ncbi:hypothetical protein C0J52_04215 [Blattella germanica]|nr:hypothetical protein C0J52_04215 [Blattella germanica]
MWRDFSVISQFSTIPGNATHVDESAVDTTVQSFLSKLTTPKVPDTYNKDIQAFHAALEKLDLKEAKKAGAFLDGCNVYLSGFNPEQTEKLRRILNGGGATRFNEISDSVSHILVGEGVASDRKSLQESGCRPHIVTVDWLVESIKQKRSAPEEPFLCTNVLLPSIEPPSPLSKKGLQMLCKPNEKPIPPAFNLDAENGEHTTKHTNHSEAKNKFSGMDDIVVQEYLNADDNREKDEPNIQHFLNNAKPDNSRQNINVEEKTKTEPTKTCGPDCVDRPLHGIPSDNASQETNATQDCTQCTENTILPIFSDLTFLVIGYEEHTREQLQDVIESRGGRVVNKRFKGVADYAVVPLEGANFSQTASEVVTCMWVDDCHTEDELVPIMYYHRPISVDTEKKPLSNCVIGITSYVGHEREYILSVAKLLGAK